jgi:hypothetical protein
MEIEEELYHDYLIISNILWVHQSLKVGMLKQLFKAYPNRWRVIGITESALNLFYDNHYHYKTGLKIKRCHIVDCSNSYCTMMKKIFRDYHEWWDFYYENDKTVLGLSSENKNISRIPYFPIDDSRGFFKDQGYLWKQGKDERELLQYLYENKGPLIYP